jgi:hypothetical protein
MRINSYLPTAKSYYLFSTIGTYTVAAVILDMVPLLKTGLKSPEKIRPFLDVTEKAGTTLAKAP